MNREQIIEEEKHVEHVQDANVDDEGDDANYVDSDDEFINKLMESA